MNTQHAAPSCERKEELVDYLYDEMPLAQRTRFAEHLQTCASCRTDLSGLQEVRSEMRSWDLGVAPRLEVVIPRSPGAILKELLGMFPVWSRALLATASAAALVLVALGAVSLFKGGNAPSTVAQQPASPFPAATMNPVAVPVTTKVALTPELRQVISAEISKAVEAERQSLRAQLATLEARNHEQQAQLQAVSRKLQGLNARQQQMAAAQQPSLRSIFAEYDSGGER
jgi:anti-sigma factor RsiW